MPRWWNGRHKALKMPRRKAYRFDSGLGHQIRPSDEISRQLWLRIIGKSVQVQVLSWAPKLGAYSVDSSGLTVTQLFKYLGGATPSVPTKYGDCNLIAKMLVCETRYMSAILISYPKYRCSIRWWWSSHKRF